MHSHSRTKQYPRLDRGERAVERRDLEYITSSEFVVNTTAMQTGHACSRHALPHAARLCTTFQSVKPRRKPPTGCNAPANLKLPIFPRKSTRRLPRETAHYKHPRPSRAVDSRYGQFPAQNISLKSPNTRVSFQWLGSLRKGESDDGSPSRNEIRTWLLSVSTTYVRKVARSRRCSATFQPEHLQGLCTVVSPLHLPAVGKGIIKSLSFCTD